ncbi:MAG: hypothetical protein ABI743_06450 [bacterium]
MNAQHRLMRRKAAISTIAEVMGHQSQSRIVHYSCETLYERSGGQSPRITSIAVQSVEQTQSESFSIHKVAELENALDQIGERYPELEKKMLEEFYEYVSRHQGYWWVHWNMRDMNYGFSALEHRLRALKGEPVIIPEEKRIDLANLLKQVYGANYAPSPRLESIMNLNGISNRSFVPGSEEPKLFNEGNFMQIHQSTLRKVEVIKQILLRTWEGTLKTNAGWRDMYGTDLIGVLEAFLDSWTFKILGILGILASLFSAVYGVWANRY